MSGITEQNVATVVSYLESRFHTEPMRFPKDSTKAVFELQSAELHGRIGFTDGYLGMLEKNQTLLDSQQLDELMADRNVEKTWREKPGFLVLITA